jgi:hypothetical protein
MYTSIKYYIAGILTMICFSSFTISGQDLTKMSYEAYLSNDVQNWEYVVSTALIGYKKTPNNPSAGFNLALARYGLLGATMYANEEEIFDQHLDATKDVIDELIDSNNSWAEPKALASFVLGFQIS